MTVASSTPQKNIFVVIGMARSGTSAIARGLQALGIDLGKKLTPGSEKWNPKGFFEDNDIVYKINRRVLYSFDYSWMGVSLVDNRYYTSPAMPTIKKMAIDLLKERIADTQYWGFKDPRTAKVLPFWQDIFSTLNVNDHYVIALRNPLASAYSYQRVSGTDIEVGLLLWMMHLIPAIDHTQGKKRVIVSYDAMMQDPHLQLARVKEAFQLPEIGKAGAIDEYAHQFLDKSLQHYEYSYDDFKNHAATAVAPICLNVYDLLLRVAKDELAFESDEFKKAWQVIKQEFEQVYPIYCYMDQLLKKNKSLERVIRSIHRSVPWKLLYPLRFIDNIFRAYRRKRREKRRLVKSYG